ncbi:MAG: T9SS type A sorting domain-containing protein, partial [Bacteroidia bacterium]|nr:T9SS type A sorting domain-containing protein [Bacteroidia bacterium]
SAGTILKTSDKGDTWTALPGIPGEYLKSVFFTNENSGFVSDYQNTVYKTTDGGVSWTPYTFTDINFIHSLYFVNDSTGYAGGYAYSNQVNTGKIFKTTDGGISWTTCEFADVMLYSVFFHDELTGFAAGYKDHVGGAIYKTTDGGVSWTDTTFQGGPLNSVNFISPGTGYCAGYAGRILKTTDNGTTWNNISLAENYYLSNLFFTSGEIGFVCGENGLLVKTTDAGQHWAPYSFDNKTEWYHIQFFDIMKGYLVGSKDYSNGFLYSSADGGFTWNLKKTFINVYLRDAHFFNINEGVLIGNSKNTYIPYSYKTTDAGATWTINYDIQHGDMQDIFFTDDHTGYIATNDALYKTYDAGSHWILQSQMDTLSFVSVYFTAGDTGYAAARNNNNYTKGYLLKTTNGGNNWENKLSVTNPDNPAEEITGLWFTCYDTGFAAGPLNKFYRTYDGGETWDSLNIEILYDAKFCFADKKTGYFAGKYMYKTTDGGITWQIKDSIIPEPLCIDFIDARHGWTAGYRSAITATFTGFENEGEFCHILNITDSSGTAHCHSPYSAHFYLTGEYLNTQDEDTLIFSIHFGDGTDTVIYKNIDFPAGYFSTDFSHTYTTPGQYTVRAISAAPSLISDTLIKQNMVLVSDTCSMITGWIFNDINNNCVKDPFEQGIGGRPVSLWYFQELVAITYTNPSGFYAFDVPSELTYTIRLESSVSDGYVLSCPFSYYTVSDSFPSQENNFGMNCTQGFDMAVIMNSTRFRPGRITNAGINAWNLSCQPFTGFVTLYLDPLVSFVSSSPQPTQIYDDSCVWIINDFNNESPLYIPLALLTDTSGLSGQTVCFTVKMLPKGGDNDTSNNIFHACYPVVNSFDPNDKQVSPANTSTPVPLTYTIHFQNTGTAEAYDIIIMDTLDPSLDLGSLRLTAYSHPVQLNVINSQPRPVLKFSFHNIMLPDSNSNLLLSNGFVQYSIKIKNNTPLGTQIDNKAHIFFDFNPAIATNTAEMTYQNTGGVKENFIDNNLLNIYPNPAQNLIYLKFSDISFSYGELFFIDMLGRKISGNKKIKSTKEPVDVSFLPDGMYILHVVSENKKYIQKFIIRR